MLLLLQLFRLLSHVYVQAYCFEKFMHVETPKLYTLSAIKLQGVCASVSALPPSRIQVQILVEQGARRKPEKHLLSQQNEKTSSLAQLKDHKYVLFNSSITMVWSSCKCLQRTPKTSDESQPQVFYKIIPCEIHFKN